MRRAWMVVLVALAARLVPWAAGLGDRTRVMQSPDCHDYERAAVNLLDHGTLSLSAAPPIEPDTFRTPGYPLFVAAVYAVAGRHPHAAVLAQILLAAVSCGLLIRWGEPLVGAGAATLAGLAWALDPGAVANSGILLSEPWCLFLLMAAYLALAPALATASAAGLPLPLPPARAALAGASLGLAALVRPAMLYFPGVVALALAAAHGRRAGRPLAILVLAFALPCSVWIARNAISTGVAEFSSLEGQNLLFYRASGVLARARGIPLAEAWKDLAREANAELARRGWPRARYGELCKELGIKVFMRYPTAYLPVLAAGAFKAWTGLSIYDVLKHFGMEPRGLGLFEKGLSGIPGRLAALTPLERIAVGFDLFMRLAALTLGLAGVLALAQRRAWTALAVILPALVYVTFTAGSVISYYRFRLPATPFWCLAVGVALQVIRAGMASRPPHRSLPSPG